MTWYHISQRNDSVVVRAFLSLLHKPYLLLDAYGFITRLWKQWKAV